MVNLSTTTKTTRINERKLGWDKVLRNDENIENQELNEATSDSTLSSVDLKDTRTRQHKAARKKSFTLCLSSDPQQLLRLRKLSENTDSSNCFIEPKPRKLLKRELKKFLT